MRITENHRELLENQLESWESVRNTQESWESLRIATESVKITWGSAKNCWRITWESWELLRITIYLICIVLLHRFMIVTEAFYNMHLCKACWCFIPHMRSHPLPDQLPGEHTSDLAAVFSASTYGNNTLFLHLPYHTYLQYNTYIQYISGSRIWSRGVQLQSA